MKEQLDTYRLPNGMIVLGEPLKDVESVSINFLLPCGAAFLPDGCCGAGEVITDWIFRGAGTRSSRELIETLDGFGIHRNSSVTAENISFSASLEAANLLVAIDLYADILLEPRLEDQQFEPSRQLAIHELAGLDDDPRHKVMLLLNEQFYPEPYNRPADGKMQDLRNLTPQQCRTIIKTKFDWSQCIFSISGKYDFHAVCGLIEKRFGSCIGKNSVRPSAKISGQKYTHLKTDGAQVHIGLMTRVPEINHSDYYNIMTAVSVLSGGMSSRLFTEVREKRGLCYAVGARYQTLKNHAGISCYAGTTPDKANETLEVIIEEFQKLKKGIMPDEMRRAKVGLKSSLIMQSESSLARASGIAGDYYYLGKVRTITEIREKIESVNLDSVMGFLNKHPFLEFTITTIGPREVRMQ